jgi:hypothetical protein
MARIDQDLRPFVTVAWSADFFDHTRAAGEASQATSSSEEPLKNNQTGYLRLSN